jgi:hypothetical protein
MNRNFGFDLNIKTLYKTKTEAASFELNFRFIFTVCRSSPQRTKFCDKLTLMPSLLNPHRLSDLLSSLTSCTASPHRVLQYFRNAFIGYLIFRCCLTAAASDAILNFFVAL